MLHRRYFTIIEESGVTEALAEAIKDDPRADEVFEALKWVLSRDPNQGTPVQHEGIDYKLIYFLPIKAAKNPYILARYMVMEEEEEVLIDWIKVFPYDDELAYTPPAFDIND